MKDTVQHFLNRRVLVVPKTATVRQAARALHENRVGCAIVSDKRGHMVGLVTDRDLATLILGFGLTSSTPVSDVMTTNVQSVDSSARITEVLKIMEDRGIRRVPVIERSHKKREKCVGIVTLDDLIASEVASAASVARIVRSQITRRWKNFEPKAMKQDKKSHTLNKFIKQMSEGLGLQRSSAELVTSYFLRQIVLRLNYTAAAHFISQLPSLLQDELFAFKDADLESNESIDFVEGIMEEFQIGRNEALLLAQSFWTSLEDVMDGFLLGHVLEQLPADIRTYFCGTDAPYMRPEKRGSRFYVTYV